MTRYLAGHIFQLAATTSIAGSVAAQVFVSLSLIKEVCLVAGERFLGQQHQELLPSQSWKLSDFLRENNLEEGMRDERRQVVEDNLISGRQYIVFSSYGDYFLSVLREVCKSLAT